MFYIVFPLPEVFVFEELDLATDFLLLLYMLYESRWISNNRDVKLSMFLLFLLFFYLTTNSVIGSLSCLQDLNHVSVSNHLSQMGVSFIHLTC